MTNLELINLAQRITGIAAFSLITLQILLSTNRKFLKYHMLNGIFAYFFVFMHPILMIAYRYVYSSELDPFYVYTDLCVLCNSSYEHFINLGRISFYLITITVFTAKFRNGILFLGKKTSDFIVNNWRKMHILNYAVFYFVSVHAINIGTDSLNTKFIYFFWICQAIVMYAILKRIVDYLKFKRS